MKAATIVIFLFFISSVLVLTPDIRAFGSLNSNAVLCEVGTATWCTACPNTGRALHQIQQSDDAFYYVTMVADKVDQAADRINQYNIAGYPTSFFDGGYSVVFGGKSDPNPYQDAILSSRSRDRPDIDLSVQVGWMGDGQLDILITASVSSSYKGRLRAYVVEPYSRWDDYDGEPYRFAFLDFAFDRDVDFNGAMVEQTSWNGSEAGFPDIARDNIMIIAALFTAEAETRYADPPTNTKPFEAYYVDAVGAGRPPEDATPTLALTEKPNHLVGVSNVTFAWEGIDDFTSAEELQYSYRLLGYDTQWSSWDHTTLVMYQGVPDGTYTFKVTVRDSLDQVRTISWEFTVDTGAPRVVSTRPSNNAQGVSPFDPVVVTFSHPMDFVTVTNALSVEPAIDFTLVWRSNDVLVIAPEVAWQIEAIHTITIGTGARRTSGQSLTQPHMISFVTLPADTSPPTILQTKPSGGGVIASEALIQIFFSEPMDTGFFSHAVDLDPWVAYHLHWSENDTIVSIIPKFLPPGMYAVTVTTYAADKTGNRLLSNYSFSFHVQRPRVLETLPSDGERGVPVDTAIYVTFSQEMTYDSVKQALSYPFEGLLTLEGNRSIITPATNLTYDTQYVVSVADTAANIYGVTMQQDYSFSFFTERGPPTRHTENATSGFSVLLIIVGLAAAVLLTRRL